MPLLRVGERRVVGAARHAERQRGDRDPAAVQDLHRVDEPFAASADHRLGGNDAVLHDHFGGVGGPEPHLVFFFPARKPGVPVSIANAEIPFFSRSGSVTANTIVRSPTEPWVVNVFEPFRIHPPPGLGTRRGLRSAGVASGRRLGQAPRADPLPEASFGTYVFRCASFAAREDMIRAQRVVRRDRDPDRAVDARELLDDDDVLDVAQSRAAQALRETGRRSTPRAAACLTSASGNS